MHVNICKTMNVCIYTYVPLYNTNKPGQHLTVLKVINMCVSTLASWWNCSEW